MKINMIGLKAFGCFTDYPLEFTGHGTNFHIIYGDNEAGKSTALRAVNALLYGIPERTQDNFVHDNNDLRIEGILEKSDGSTLQFIRRKGRKDTILDARGSSALHDSALDPYLYGVQEELFQMMFGFDYQSMLAARASLMEGRGDLADTIFGAAMGIKGLKSIRDELAESSAQYFSSRRNSVVVKAIKDYEDAIKSRNEYSVRPSKWAEIKGGIDSAIAQLTEVRTTRDERSAELERYRRFAGALPLVSQRQQVEKLLQRCEEFIALSAGEIESYVQHSGKLEELREQKSKLENERSDIANEWPESGYIDAIIELGEDIGGVLLRKTQYDDAVRDLPKLEKELANAKKLAMNTLDELGSEKAFSNPALYCLMPADRLRIVEFLKECARIEIEQGPPDSLCKKDASGLRNAVDAAHKEGDIEERLANQEGEIEELDAAASVLLAGLPMWTGTLEDLAKLTVPLRETVDRFETDLTELKSDRTRINEAIKAIEEKLDQHRKEIRTLELAGQVPSERVLSEARVYRDQGWKLVKRAWIDGVADSSETLAYAAGMSLDAAYETSVSAADDVGDRLRFEAERVAKLAQLLAEIEDCEIRLEKLQSELTLYDQQIQDTELKWSNEWKPAGIDNPPTPREMRSWLSSREEIRAVYTRLEKAKREALKLGERIKIHRERVGEEMALVGIAAPEADVDLEGLLRHAKCFLENINRFEKLSAQAEKWKELQLRVGDIGQMITLFERDVKGLMDHDCFQELRHTAPDEAALELNKRLTKARTDLARLDQINRQLMDIGGKIAEQDEALQRLTEKAECEDFESLTERVRKSEDYHKLWADKSDLDRDLAQYTAGTDVEVFISEMNTLVLDPDKLPGIINGLEQEITDLENNRDRISTQKGSLVQQLDGLDKSDLVEQAAQAAQDALARAQSGVERYLPLYLAAQVLEMAIEHYSAQNQDPVIRRASELFSTLTLGSFGSVSTSFDSKDNQIIVGIRRSGKSVAVSGMSDGTRDQLYLALRMASLEQRVKTGEPFPLIMDDVLIEFDRKRIMAALNVLAELSESTQVLYFTHQDNILELAQESVPGRFAAHSITTAV